MEKYSSDVVIKLKLSSSMKSLPSFEFQIEDDYEEYSSHILSMYITSTYLELYCSPTSANSLIIFANEKDIQKHSRSFISDAKNVFGLKLTPSIPIATATSNNLTYSFAKSIVYSILSHFTSNGWSSIGTLDYSLGSLAISLRNIDEIAQNNGSSIVNKQGVSYKEVFSISNCVVDYNGDAFITLRTSVYKLKLISPEDITSFQYSMEYQYDEHERRDNLSMPSYGVEGLC